MPYQIKCFWLSVTQNCLNSKTIIIISHIWKFTMLFNLLAGRKGPWVLSRFHCVILSLVLKGCKMALWFQIAQFSKPRGTLSFLGLFVCEKPFPDTPSRPSCTSPCPEASQAHLCMSHCPRNEILVSHLNPN